MTAVLAPADIGVLDRMGTWPSAKSKRNFWENKTGPKARKPLAQGRIPGSWKGMIRDSCYM